MGNTHGRRRARHRYSECRRSQLPVGLFGACAAVLALSGTAAQAAHAQAPMRMRETGRIGCVNCGNARLLSNVLEITLGPNETVYILDATRPKVRVFNRNGRLLRTAMPEGRSPGQGLLPIAAIVRDSSLYVIDMQLSRITVLAPDGAPLATRELPDPPTAVAYRPPFPYLFYATIDYSTTPLTPRIWRLGLNDSIPEPVYASTDGFPRGRDGDPTSFFAFTMTPSGGFAIGEGAYAYRIREFDDRGRAIRDIERDVPRTRMTEPELQRALERRRLAMGRIGSLARLEGGNPGPLGEIDPEENFFSAAALRYDTAGRLWVKTDRGSRDTVFDVFDSEGNLRWEARAADALGVYDIADGFLAGFGFGDRDAPVVRVYRLER